MSLFLPGRVLNINHDLGTPEAIKMEALAWQDIQAIIMSVWIETIE